MLLPASLGGGSDLAGLCGLERAVASWLRPALSKGPGVDGRCSLIFSPLSSAAGTVGLPLRSWQTCGWRLARSDNPIARQPLLPVSAPSSTPAASPHETPGQAGFGSGEIAAGLGRIVLVALSHFLMRP